MKKLLTIILTLAACTAALCLTAAAEDVPMAGAAPVRVWGQVSPWEGEGVFLKNDDPEDSLNEAVVHLGEAPVVDAATGLPLDPESIQEGDTLYVWAGPAATLSLPPQVRAIVAVGNVPADAAAPEYCVIAGEAVVPAPGGDGSARFPLLGGGTLEVTGETEYTPWLTRQLVRMEDLVPGAGVLVWKNDAGQAEKVLVFAYGYQGYVSYREDGTVFLNGEELSVPGKVETNAETGEDLVYLPLRAVAAAAGYDVQWDKNRGAVVQDQNVDLVFCAVPGEQVIFRNGEEIGIAAPCILENGVTYLPAADMAYWLNLFFVE